MGTAVFVHGTGVREPRFSALFQRVREGLAEVASGLEVVPCYWGGELGARLRAGGASVPGYARSRGGAGIEGPEAEDPVAFWDALYRDPLAELAAYSASALEAGELPPGAPPPEERPGRLLRALIDSLAHDTDLPSDLRHTMVEQAAELARSSLLGAVARGLGDEELARALARAVVAAAIAEELDEDAAVICDGATRDRAVAAGAAAMGAPPEGASRAPAAARLLLRPTLRLASRQAVRHRRSITDAAHPAAGDVMLYLARGERIRRYLRELVQTRSGPVVLIGHSLGGIAALETLISEPLPQVELLVTVGSQAPFLYETDALPTLQHPAGLPAHVPPWLNLYDPRDLLAYVGGQVFPDRVEDVEVDNDQPFPAAHSAYWTNREVYRAIAARLP